MDKKKLLSLLAREEGRKLDFKQRIELNYETGKKELTKDICAIANSNGGRGYIVVGIEDKTKKIIGISEEDKFNEEKIQQIIASRCDPPIPVSVDYIKIEEKDVAVITIYNWEQRPYQVRESGAFFIRRGSTTDIMRKQELVAAFEESLNLNIEACAVVRSDMSALNMGIVDKYFKSKSIEINDGNREFLLQRSSITSRDRETGEIICTLGGLLVFSDINSIYIPHNMIKIINKINKNMPEVIIVQGNIINMIDLCEVHLKELLPDNYPYSAVLEAIKNAVLYREYSEFSRIIEVYMGYNSIVVMSPGELMKTNKKNGDTRDYNRRNMWLYEKVITLDDKGRFLKNNTGLVNMKKAFKGKGKIIFINSKQENVFKVIFPGVSEAL
jgi:predicted HTH transcriptional regulator